MQINLTGFLNGKNARVFMTDLWELLLSAQESPSGIPPKFIEQKKEELKKKMVNNNSFKTILILNVCLKNQSYQQLDFILLKFI